MKYPSVIILTACHSSLAV